MKEIKEILRNTRKSVYGNWEKFRLLHFVNTLPYLETHVVDHCNLNCKGCGHFSPLSPPHFSDYYQFSKDISRLSELFDNIEILRLMGGEPLLHPEIVRFVDIARQKLPHTDIRVVTNGILLSRMDQSFWESIKNKKITIDVTIYPKTSGLTKTITEIADRKFVNINIIHTHEFFKVPIDLNGSQDINQTFNKCRRYINCPFLRDGHIYLCVNMAMFELVEKTFQLKTSIKVKPVNIHSNITRKDIIQYLNNPAPYCRFCNFEKLVFFPWDNSEYKIDEWI